MYYEIYLDLFLLKNFFMDTVLLFLLGSSRKWKIKWLHILLAAFLNDVILGIVILCHFNMCILVLFLPILMVKFAYWDLKGKKLITAVLYLYLLTALLGGGINVLKYRLHIPAAAELTGMGLVLGACVIYHMLTETELNLVKTELVLHDKKVSLKALYDTGNCLTVPGSTKGVNIVQYQTVKELMKGSEAFFLIPYHTIGKENGLLPCMIFESLTVEKQGEILVRKRPAIALTKEYLSTDGSYQMILHPQYLNMK